MAVRSAWKAVVDPQRVITGATTRLDDVETLEVMSTVYAWLERGLGPYAILLVHQRYGLYRTCLPVRSIEPHVLEI